MDLKELLGVAAKVVQGSQRVADAAKATGDVCGLISGSVQVVQKFETASPEDRRRVALTVAASMLKGLSAM